MTSLIPLVSLITIGATPMVADLMMERQRALASPWLCRIPYMQMLRLSTSTIALWLRMATTKSEHSWWSTFGSSGKKNKSSGRALLSCAVAYVMTLVHSTHVVNTQVTFTTNMYLYNHYSALLHTHTFPRCSTNHCSPPPQTRASTTPSTRF